MKEETIDDAIYFAALVPRFEGETLHRTQEHFYASALDAVQNPSPANDYRYYFWQKSYEYAEIAYNKRKQYRYAKHTLRKH